MGSAMMGGIGRVVIIQDEKLVVSSTGWRDKTTCLICEDLFSVLQTCGIAEVRTGSRVGTGGEEIISFLTF